MLFRVLSDTFIFFRKKKITVKMTLSFIVTCCQSLSFVVPTTRCHSLFHLFSFFITCCHSLSLVVPLVVTRCIIHLSFYYCLCYGFCISMLHLSRKLKAYRNKHWNFNTITISYPKVTLMQIWKSRCMFLF